MCSIVDELAKEIGNPRFLLRQNEIATEAKTSLQVSRDKGENEVKTVTRLCNTLNGKNINRINLHTKKIHGRASCVMFLNEANSVAKRELSDMVVLSLITEKGCVLYARIAFIQNKMEDKSKEWNIEQDQLYLLTNFPTFDGVSGIFGKKTDIALPNPCGQLGNYGLFCAPCEMIFANAGVITALQKGTRVTLDEIKKLTAANKCASSRYEHVISYIDEFHYVETALPILGTCSVALNMHQFIRNWTQFNIGEEIVIGGNPQSPVLIDLARKYMKAAGFADLADLRFEYNNERVQNDDMIEDDAAVMVAHLEIG